MATTIIFCLCFFFAWIPNAIGVLQVTKMTSHTQQSSCGSWVPFTDYKCLHIVDSALFQTKDEAEVVCQSLADIMNLDDIPQLVTVRTENEQIVLQQFLFNEIGLLEPIWLGLEINDDGLFRWNNGAEMRFNNLAKQNASDADRPCVQMESGHGSYPMGQWIRVNCRKRNVVVCEKIQVWTTAKLQNSFLNLKSEVETLTEKMHKLSSENGIDSQDNGISLAKTRSQPSPSSNSPCGNWTPYKHESCIKLIELHGFKTKEEAEVVCKTTAGEVQGSNVPKLVTIKTEDKQRFVHDFLFKEMATPDTVWLGLAVGKDGGLRWNDGTELFFANWIGDAVNATTSDRERNCVQMESGEGVYKAGKWVRVYCKKKNAVVCERTQPLTIASLQNVVLNHMAETEKNKREFEQKLIVVKKEAEQNINIAKQDAEQKINGMAQMISKANEEIDNLKKNPVPLGFIYVQLPGNDPPAILWPQTEWKDVGSEYAGLFFRVEGGEAAPFGDLQEDNTRRLAQVWHVATTKWTSPIIPEDGTWTDDVFTGNAGPGTVYGIRFRLTTGEVRPRNKSVKIWKRIK